MATIQSTTYWMEDDYEIEIIFGQFSSKEAAQEFGKHVVKSLKFYEGNLILSLKNGQGFILKDNQVKVYRMKATSRDKYIYDQDDFELIDLKISAFKETFGSSVGFQSMAYGTIPY